MASTGTIKRHRVLSLRQTLLGLLITCVVGCDDPVQGPEYTNPLPELVGQWDLKQSCGGFTGGCSYPQDPSMAMTWVFTSDDFFQWFRSDSLLDSGPFRVVKGELGISNREAYILWVNGVSTLMALDLIAVDTLSVVQDCYDCFTMIWTRH